MDVQSPSVFNWDESNLNPFLSAAADVQLLFEAGGKMFPEPVRKADIVQMF